MSRAEKNAEMIDKLIKTACDNCVSVVKVELTADQVKAMREAIEEAVHSAWFEGCDYGRNE